MFDQLFAVGAIALIGWASRRRSRMIKTCLVLACFFSAGGFAQAGNFFVSNYNSNTIEQYSSTGADLGVFASSGLSQPQGLVFDGSGNLYVANWNSNTIEKFSSTGQDLGVFASAGLDEPCELALDRSGNLYVANWGNNTIDNVWFQRKRLCLRQFRHERAGFHRSAESGAEQHRLVAHGCFDVCDLQTTPEGSVLYPFLSTEK